MRRRWVTARLCPVTPRAVCVQADATEIVDCRQAGLGPHEMCKPKDTTGGENAQARSHSTAGHAEGLGHRVEIRHRDALNRPFDARFGVQGR